MNTLSLEELVDLFVECFDQPTPPQYFTDDLVIMRDLTARMNYFNDFKQKLTLSNNPKLVQEAYYYADQIFTEQQIVKRFLKVKSQSKAIN